jgi:thiamine-monophosphate kinase
MKPEPRLALGQYLRTKLRATAAMDISDGLSLDLERLCVASKVNAEIADPPTFPGASIEQALHGGEEYELLFTVRAGTRVPPAFEGLALTRIGVIRRPDRITKNQAGQVRLSGKLLLALGYDHFKAK